MTPQIMTSEQVAELIGCTDKTVDDMARGGKLPAAKIGNRWLFTADRLHDYINRQIDAREVSPVASAIKHPGRKLPDLTLLGG
jgi:excisionase family DNA binding protein